MKLLNFLLLFWSFTIFAQQAEEVALPSIAPNSPEATEFIKHGDMSVNMYTGKPEISIPIYTVKGREFSLPVSLNYDAGGIRVDQISTEVGLAWSLQAGGVITRITNGKPDHVLGANGYYGSYYTHYDKLKAFYQTSVSELEIYQPVDPSYFSTLQEYFSFEKNHLLTGEIDTQPDYFSFNVGTISGEVYIDPVSGKVISSNGGDYKISYTGSLTNFTGGGILSWHIIDENGNQYFFNKYDVTQTYELSYNDHTKSFISSWQLTKIISANGLDEINFVYSSADFWVNEKKVPDALSQVSTLVSEGQTVDCQQQSGGFNSNSPSYQIAQHYLSSISLNGEIIVSFDRDSIERKDLSSRYALNKISISNGIEWELQQSYFKTSAGLDLTNVNEDDVRLKLDALTKKSSGSSEEQNYIFEYYNENNMPNRLSFSQDYWGFYNGKSNSSTYGLIPKETIVSGGVQYNFPGADRSPDLLSTINGTLKSITYPTGGRTEFDYELHKVNSFGESIENEDAEIGSLTGGNDPEDPYNYYDDEYFYDDPKGKEITVPVYESGTKQIKIKYNSPPMPHGPGDNDDGILFVALFKCSAGVPEDPDCGGSPQLLPNCFAGMDWDDMVYYSGSEKMLLKSYKGGPDVDALPNGYSETITLNLEAGYYRLYLLNGVTNSELSVNMGYTSIVSGNIQKEVGGLRVKKIRDYEGDLGQLARSKEYAYNETAYNSCGDSYSSSTGKLHFDPNFSYYSYYYKRTSGGNGTCTYLERFSQPLNPQQSPHVAYSLVTETYSDQNGGDNGSTKYRFYNKIESTDPVHSPPFLKSDFKNGKIAEILVYDSLGNLQKKSQNIYNQTMVENSIQGFQTSLGQYKEDAGLQVYTNEQYFEMVYPGVCVGGSGWCYYYSQDATVIYQPPFSQKLHQQYTITNNFVHLDEQIVTDYFEGDSLVTEKKYFYDGLGFPKTHRQVSRSMTSSSKGEIVETYTYYPDDIESASFLDGEPLTASEFSAIENLKKVKNNGLSGQHQTGKPIQVQVIVKDQNGNPLSTTTTRTNYKDWGSGMTLPKDIQQTKGELLSTTPLDTIVVFDYYDSSGNLIEVSKAAGPPVTYLWGYNDQLPIAKIENATSSEVSSILGPLSDVDETDLSAINALRTSLPQAMVSTYEYEPFVGVTKITDPKGLETTYHYDIFNRLEFIKDDQGNLIEEFKYNYKN